jgi:hypothetical protein
MALVTMQELGPYATAQTNEDGAVFEWASLMLDWKEAMFVAGRVGTKLEELPFRFDPEAWDRVKEEYMEVCLERWRQYAPNLDGKNMLAKYAFTPLDVERKRYVQRHHRDRDGHDHVHYAADQQSGHARDSSGAGQAWTELHFPDLVFPG